MIKDDGASNFVDNDIVNDMFDNNMDDKNIMNISIKEGSLKNNPLESGRDEKEIVFNGERRASQQSFRTNKKNETQGSYRDSVKETVQKLEDNEKLFSDQVLSYLILS